MTQPSDEQPGQVSPWGAPQPPPGYAPAPGWQGQPPAGYGYGPPGGRPPGTNGMAIAGFVLTFFFWPLGIVFSFIGLSQTKRTGQGGHGLALAGAIISCTFGAVIVLLIVVAVSLGSGSSAGPGVSGLGLLLQS